MVLNMKSQDHQFKQETANGSMIRNFTYFDIGAVSLSQGHDSLSRHKEYLYQL